MRMTEAQRHCFIFFRGQRNSPMPARSVGVPPTIPERDYSSPADGTSEGDQEREQDPAGSS